MSVNNMRLSGINSGFDTEAMIQQMMSAYQTKIDNQNKKLQKLQWQQEAYRDITSKLTGFKGKYFDILKRDSYLMSPSSFSNFKPTVTTKSGKESGLKVTTNSKSSEGSYKIQVKNTATAAKRTGKAIGSNQFELDVDKALKTSQYTVDDAGNRKYDFELDVQVGGVTKTISFSANAVQDANGKVSDLSASQFKDEVFNNLNAELQDAFGETVDGSGKWFVQAMKNADGSFGFDINGNAGVSITEKTGNFGLTKPSSRVAISPEAALTGENSISVSFANVSGENITRNIKFNAVSATYFNSRNDAGNEAILQEFNDLKMASYREAYGLSYTAEVSDEELNKYQYSSAQAASDKNSAAITSALNSEFAFEQGVSFSINGSYVTAQHVITGETVEFTMTSTCEATFGLQKGSATNKFTDSTKLSEMKIEPNDGENYSMEINGKKITVGADATIGDLLNAVNKSDAGVTMSYSKLENKFVIEANDMGTGGDVRIADSDVLAKALGLTEADGAKVDAGKNALININGVDVYHNSNTYTDNGVSFDFSEVETDEVISVNVNKDYDKIKQTIRDFVKDYNQLIDDVYGQIGTRRPQDKNKNYYEPLTDEEKEDMSDKEIEKWEEAAKKGLLYNDSTVSGIMSKLRTALYGAVELEDGKKFGLYNMGIKASKDYADHGKLEIDDDAFDKAFEENADAIIKLFTDSEQSIMKKANTVIDNAVRTTGKVKGSLIRRAGLEKGSSATDNQIYKEMERINKRIETLQDRYDKKEEYWWSVFTNLEKMMSDFNSQQNYMASYLGSGTAQ